MRFSNLLPKISRFGDVAFRYWTLIPLFVFILVLTLYPVVEVIRMAFSNLTLAEGKYIWEFAGLSNFYRMLSDAIFGVAIKNTVLFVIIVVAFEFIFGLILAIATTKVPCFAGLYRTILILPILVPPIAISTMWRIMYNPNFGFINQVAFSLGLAGQNWLADPRYALLAITVVDVWHWTSYVFLILLAGLQSIPKEPYEAAIVDGASEFQLFRYITWPLLLPTIIVALMFRTIFSFKVFDEIFVLTGGGPGTATEIVSTYIYRVFFQFQKMDYASFLSLTVIIIVIAFLVGYQTLLRRGVSQ